MEMSVKKKVRTVAGQSPKERKGKFALCAMRYALCSFLLAGCATEKPSLVVYSFPLDPAGKAILVQHFDFNPEISTQVKKEAVQKFGELIALDIQRGLKAAGFQHPLVVAPGEQSRGDLLIKGTITRVHGGDSRERKWFEVFGYGATELRVSGEIVDLAGARSAAAFSLVKQSSYTWMDNDAAVRENLREIAQEIAAILIQAK
ncbi:MAG: hypothetical protein H6Q44_51 [Deltaproteobacteria bacterium]|nr:hypothetical protein [Deltaproteobacteria bacterium]